MPIDFEIGAELRDLLDQWSRNREFIQTRARSCNAFAQLLLIGGERFAERFAISIVAFTPLDDVDTILKIVLGCDFGVQSEAIEQLRPEFPFFRIARTNQHKACRMLDRNTFSLNFIDSRHRNVKQQIDEVIFEQVHFVDI